MKKLFVGLFATLLMGAGLVGVTPGSAVAACPYTGCVTTSTDAGGPHRLASGHRPRTVVKVSAAGNPKPSGSLRVTYERVKGGFSETITKGYSGGVERFRGPVLKKEGRYTVTVKFVPGSNSVWKKSADGYELVVH